MFDAISHFILSVTGAYERLSANETVTCSFVIAFNGSASLTVLEVRQIRLTCFLRHVQALDADVRKERASVRISHILPLLQAFEGVPAMN